RREKDMQSAPAQDKSHVANPVCVCALSERIRTGLEAGQRIPRTSKLAQAGQAVEVPIVAEDSQIALRSNRRPHLEMDAVGGLGRLRELPVSHLGRPRAC